MVGAFVGAGFAVYRSTIYVNPPAETLDPILMPEQLHYPSGVLKTKILMYHRMRAPKAGDRYSVSPAVFRVQMQWLRDNGYEVISYDRYYQALISTSSLPDKSVVISFDDGYRDQFRSAYPILREFGYSAIFFPYTRDIGQHDFMTYEMMRELIGAGMEIGSHTVTHPWINRMSSDDIERELENSKIALEANIGIRVNHFCYPFGWYNAEIVRAVQSAGYLSAVTVRALTSYDKKLGPYFVPRVQIENSLKSFVARVTR
jgi:peptidoglycan/xylan/chitin deacetylase (PgdA/CDA1 family)